MFSKHFHHIIGDEVPWWGHATDDVIVFEDGSMFALLKLRGITWQTLDDDALTDCMLKLNHTLCQIADESITSFVYQNRSPASPDIYPSVQPHSGLAAELNIRYKAHLLNGLLYQNSLYFGIQISAPSLFQGQKKKTKRAKHSITEEEEARLERLEAVMALLQTELSAYHPQRLGQRISNRIKFSVIAEEMHFVLTGIRKEIGITTGRLGDDLFDSHVDFTAWDTIQFLTPGSERFAMMFGIQRPPASTHPLILSRMLSCSYPCTIRHSFRFLPVTKTLSSIKWKQFFQKKFGDPSGDQSASLDTLKRDLADGLLAMGNYSCAILVFSDTTEGLRKVAPVVWNDLAASGAKITREALPLKPAFLSMIPGNSYLSPRPIQTTSINMACFAPMQNFSTGPERGHWGGPIALFRSPAGTPIFFHWQAERDDTGNTLITGEVGSGKTTLTAFLLAMTAGRAKVIALDHKRGWDFLIRKMGGSYTILGGGNPSFAPLKALEPNERNMSYLTDLIRGCIMSDGGEELTSDEDERLSQALEIVMELPSAVRSMSEVRKFLGVDRDGAGARLEKWCRGRELGWVIDAETDSIDLAEAICGLDTTALLDNDRAKGAALSYLFHRINLELDGSPTLIAVDEGWKVLADPIFGPKVAEQIRTIRSKNGAFVFVTQGAEDISESGLAGVLVQQCPNQIHFPSQRATEADYVDGLKRTNGEFAALKELRKGSGLFLLCQGPESMIGQLSLHGMDDMLAILSARQSALKAFDKVLAETGDVTEALAAIHHTRQLEHLL